MTSEQPERGSNLGQGARAAALVLLLTGGLFPPVEGVPIHAAASVIAAPLIAWELLRPGRNPAAWFTAWTIGPLITAAAFLPSPLLDYGTDKFVALYTTTAISALGVTLLRDRATVVTFAKTWAALGLLLAAMTLRDGSLSGRAAAFDANPIWVARAIVAAAIAVLWLGRMGHLRKIVWVPAAAFLTLAVVATGSRGPTIGLVAGALLVAVLATSGRTQQVLTAVSAALAAWTVLSFVPSLAQVRALSFLNALLTDEPGDVGLRGEMWRRTAALIAREPGGVGFGNWAVAAPSPSHHLYPHNLFMEALAETGWLPGTLLLATVAVTLFRLSRRVRQDPVAILALSWLANATISVSVSGDLSARTFFAMLTLGWVITTWPVPTDGHLPLMTEGRRRSPRTQHGTHR